MFCRSPLSQSTESSAEREETEMKTRKYEQPTLELVTLAANDILLTSGDPDDPLQGNLSTAYSGAKTELRWTDIWGK